MTAKLRPIRSEADYRIAVAEVERLWGAKVGLRRETVSICSRR
jgi:antitoxin component HigA of HigAB toxin-antitoxin module